MNSVVKRTSSIGPLKSKYFRFTSRNRSSSCPVKASKAETFEAETVVSQARPEPSTVAPETSKTQAYPSQHLDVPGLYNLQVTQANAEETFINIGLLLDDQRYIIADTLRVKLMDFLNGLAAADGLKAVLEARLAEQEERMQLLATRAEQCREAADGLDGTGDWVLGSSFGGIDTFYRPTGDGRYMAKVVGAFENISVFDQLAVVRETALYSTWAPLVPWSNALAHPNGFKERVVHWQQNLAVLTRDCLMRGYGCDYTERDMVLLCGEPVPDEGLPGLAFPPKPSKWLTGRMEISNFRAKITMTGPSSGKITMAAIIDPKASLPDSIVTLATKQIIGVLCYLIQKTARTMGSDALANKANKHLERIAQDPFYAHVAFPRWQAYLQHKGWGPVDHPELARMGVSEDAEQQEEEQEMGLGDESLGLQMDEQSASSISLADTRMSSYSSLDDVPAPPLKRRTSSGSRLLRSMIKTASKTFKRKRSSLTSGPSALAPLAAAQGVSRQRPILREDQRLQTQPTPDSAAKELSKMEAEAQWEKDFMARWMPVVALLCLALTWLILGPMVGPIGEAGLLACGLHQLARLAKHSTATETVQGHSDGLDASVMLLLGSLLGSGAAYTLASCNMYTLVRRTDVAADAWVQWSTSGVRGVNGVLLLVGLAALLLHRRRAAATPAAVTIVSRR